MLELNNEELAAVDGGVVSFTVGALVGIGLFGAGTVAGLIWG